MLVLRLATLACVLVLAGCPRSEAYPESVTVRSYSAPREGAAFVVVYDPWGSPSPYWRFVGRGEVEIAAMLDGVTLSCTNTPCDATSSPNVVLLKKPAPGIDHVEVLVSKEGFEPLRFSIPFARGSEGYPTRIVLLKKGAAQ
jgi:hypothetical protein